MRLRSPVTTVGSLVWGGTLLFASSWWTSPAFGLLLLPLPVWGLLLVAAAASIQWGSPGLRYVGITIFTAFAMIGAISVGWFTFVGNNVSAVGSAIAWVLCGWVGFKRIGVELHD